MSSIPTEPRVSAYVPTASTIGCRVFAWAVVGTLFAFLVNCYLSYWRDWPGPMAAFGEAPSGQAWLQILLYVGGILGAAAYVSTSRQRSLRDDDRVLTRLTSYIVEVAFWIVLLIGVADALISFLRVEALLTLFVSEETAGALGRNAYRGPVVHGPLVVAALVIPLFVRRMGFHWLALLVVIAELEIVIFRFVFSYEQAFMGDLVRLWYAALFLFASAYTLVEDGHVRVDVFYSNFSPERRGLVNALGSLLLGLPLCWVVLVLGMGSKTSIIASPLVNLEVSQQGFGMYVKYLMAGFLAVFAVTMTIQFAAYFLQGVADYRGDAGRREPPTAGAH
ncbi:MAG: TRAP transporter small permease subunit [Ectothiorhodospiraceae bacterium]|nr:TRAP transporter small permease subunit [Chromatiales bacterium]MCP5155312.1 TRAP transporter small permease subunit [Ectothiorhodospiraceae bacterium]